MGIDISSIKNEKLRELATVADKNGLENGKLEDNEISVFEAGAKAVLAAEKKDGIQAGFGENELGDIMKLVQPNVNSPVATNPVKASYSKKDIKSFEKYTMTVLKEEIGNPKLRETLVKRLGMQEPDGANINNPEYQKLLAKFDKVAEEIKKVGYNSKDDVDALKKKVNVDKKDDFTKNVLKVLIDDAEATQRKKEYKEIADSYEAKVKKGTNEEEAYKQVRKEYKNKGSYYKEYLKHGSLAYKVFHLKRKSSEFEKNTIMTDARKTARMAQRESDATSSGQVKQDAKDTMKKNGDWNKYTRKALNGENNFGEWISGQDSDMKIGRKNVARENKVEEIRENGLTEKQIHKAVDKRSTFGSKATFGLFFKKKTQLFEALKASGLIVEKDNGDYDVSKLSMIIGDNVGANYKLDRQSKDFKALSEITKTTSALAVATELKNLSPKEAKMLVEMCGYDIEGKGIDIGKAILGATAGALVSGLGGASAAATNKRPIIDTDVINKNHVEVNIKCDDYNTIQDIIKQVEGQGGQANLIEGGIQVVVDQKNVAPLYWKASRQILKTALKSAMVGAAFGMVAGLKDKPEIPITSTQFDCTTLEEYGKRLDNEVKQNAISPKYAEALKLIAATFIKKGENGETTWDCDKYKAYLNKAAGDGGILNREEFITMLERMDNNKPVDNNEQNDNVNNNHDNNVDNNDDNDDSIVVERCPVEKREIPGKDTTVTHTVKFGDSWSEIVKAYFPNYKECFGTLEGSKGAIRALKKALATDADGKLNNAIYQKLLAGYIPKKLNIPAELGGCKRNDNGKVKFKQPEGTPKGYMGTVGARTKADGSVEVADCTGTRGKGATTKDALADLNSKTGKNYTEADITENK